MFAIEYINVDDTKIIVMAVALSLFLRRNEICIAYRFILYFCRILNLFAMKKRGSVTDFKKERTAEVTKAFREAWICISSSVKGETAKVKTIADMAVKMPASRFWVSEERAANVVSRLLRGQPATDGMREPKRQMFMEIYRRVRKEMAAHPQRALVDHVCSVINQPAPEFYMEGATAIFLISRQRTERRENARK